jgi:hypothetical protein
MEEQNYYISILPCVGGEAEFLECKFKWNGVILENMYFTPEAILANINLPEDSAEIEKTLLMYNEWKVVKILADFWPGKNVTIISICPGPHSRISKEAEIVLDDMYNSTSNSYKITDASYSYCEQK